MIHINERAYEESLILTMLDNYPNLNLDDKYFISTHLTQIIKEIFMDGKRRKARVNRNTPIAGFMGHNTGLDDYLELNRNNLDIQEEYLQVFNSLRMIPKELRKSVFVILNQPCFDLRTAVMRFEDIGFLVESNEVLKTPEIVRMLLFSLLKYKFKGIGINTECEIGNDMNGYFSTLLSWIHSLIKDTDTCENQSKVHIELRSIASAIYMLLKDLGIENKKKYIQLFSLCFDNTNGLIVQNTVNGYITNDSDFMVSLDHLSDIPVKIQQRCEKLTKIETNETISDEVNKNTLVFGDNIFSNHDVRYEVNNMLQHLHEITEEVAKNYMNSANINIGEITFNLSDQTKMYLKDTGNIKLLDIYYGDNTTRTIMYCEGESPCHFVVFEKINGADSTVYGLSLEEKSGERQLLTLEKDKDANPTYKFLLGAFKVGE